MPSIEELNHLLFTDFAMENSRRAPLVVLGEHAFGTEQGRIVTVPSAVEASAGGGAGGSGGSAGEEDEECSNIPKDFTTIQIRLALSFAVIEAVNNTPCEDFSGSIVLDSPTYTRGIDFTLVFDNCSDILDPGSFSVSPTDTSGQLSCGEEGTSEAGFEATVYSAGSGVFNFFGAANFFTECVNETEGEDGYCNFDPGDIAFPSVSWDGEPGVFVSSKSDSSTPNGWSYSATLTLTVT